MLVTLALVKLPPEQWGKRGSKMLARFAYRTLMALAEWNASLIRAGVVGSLYDSNVQYRREDKESFLDAPHVKKQGWADCSNLAAWRVGELLAKGEHAKIRLRWKTYSDGYRGYHVLVRRADGEIEDPSLVLGMR